MTDNKPIITMENRKCPFCKKNDIELMITSSYYSIHSTFSADKKKAMIPYFHPEKIQIIKRCFMCKKSNKETIDAFQGIPSHKEVLERIKRQGLPVVIEC